MRAQWKQSNLKLVAIFFITIAGLIAQDSTSYMTPDVMRVGKRLSCRCGGCSFAVGECMMARCGFSDPMRRRIHDMQQAGSSDDAIISQVVREEGIVALSAPPSQGFWPILSWAGPGIALLVGFLFYSWWVKRNQQEPVPLTETDKAALSRFQSQIDKELEDETQLK